MRTLIRAARAVVVRLRGADKEKGEAVEKVVMIGVMVAITLIAGGLILAKVEGWIGSVPTTTGLK